MEALEEKVAMPLLEAISLNESIRVLAFPPLHYKVYEDPSRIYFNLESIISAQRLQVLDLSSIVDIKFYSRAFEIIEKSESVHTIVAYPIRENICEKIFEMISEMLIYNFSVQHICTLHVSFSYDEAVPTDLFKLVRNRLKRNKRIYFIKRDINKYLSLLLLRDNQYFPAELIRLIFELYLDLLLYEEDELRHQVSSYIQTDNYIRYVEYRDGFPFTLKDIH